MIRFHDSPTERTTSATDLILSVQTAIMALVLMGKPEMQNFRGWLWLGVFASMFVTAILGTIAHGFAMSKRTNTILWQILTVSFSLCYILIISSLIFDLFGKSTSILSLYATGFLSLVLVIVCLKFASFIPKIIYIGVVLGIFMFFAVLYLWLAKKQDGSFLLLMALLTASIATIVEARKKFYIRLIWEFDHHSAYHFLQFIANYLIYYSVLRYIST